MGGSVSSGVSLGVAFLESSISYVFSVAATIWFSGYSILKNIQTTGKIDKNVQEAEKDIERLKQLVEAVSTSDMLGRLMNDQEEVRGLVEYYDTRERLRKGSRWDMQINAGIQLFLSSSITISSFFSYSRDDQGFDYFYLIAMMLFLGGQGVLHSLSASLLRGDLEISELLVKYSGILSHQPKATALTLMSGYEKLLQEREEVERELQRLQKGIVQQKKQAKRVEIIVENRDKLNEQYPCLVETRGRYQDGL